MKPYRYVAIKADGRTVRGQQNAESDADLEDKLQLLAEFGRFKGDVKALAAAVWSLERASDAAAVMRLCCG